MITLRNGISRSVLASVAQPSNLLASQSGPMKGFEGLPGAKLNRWILRTASDSKRPALELTSHKDALWVRQRGDHGSTASLLYPTFHIDPGSQDGPCPPIIAYHARRPEDHGSTAVLLYPALPLDRKCYSSSDDNSCNLIPSISLDSTDSYQLLVHDPLLPEAHLVIFVHLRPHSIDRLLLPKSQSVTQSGPKLNLLDRTFLLKPHIALYL